jgi:hypothetical protein
LAYLDGLFLASQRFDINFQDKANNAFALQAADHWSGLI